MDKQKYGIVQEDTEVVQKYETEEKTDEGRDDNASERPKRQHVGVSLEIINIPFNRKTYTHKIHQQLLITEEKYG